MSLSDLCIIFIPIMTMLMRSSGGLNTYFHYFWFPFIAQPQWTSMSLFLANYTEGKLTGETLFTFSSPPYLQSPILTSPKHLFPSSFCVVPRPRICPLLFLCLDLSNPLSSVKVLRQMSLIKKQLKANTFFSGGNRCLSRVINTGQ